MISIIYHSKKADSMECLKICTDILDQLKLPFVKIAHYPFNKKNLRDIKKSKLIIVIGGDGTVLDTFAKVATLSIPLLPINSGTLGFISSTKKSQIEPTLLNYLKNKSKYKVDTRYFLSISVKNKTYYAFNDLVISRGDDGKIIYLDTKINKTKTINLKGDGLIISTATGSTAYNLSAGGPIIHPSLPVMIFNPICPHSITIKPIVIPGDEKVEVMAYRREDKKKIAIIVDGMNKIEISPRNIISCRLHENKIQFIKPSTENYYKVLTEKLYWGR